MTERYTFAIVLADVEVRERESSSFEIPSRAEREDLWPGDLVKLIFTNIGERLWVKVSDRTETNFKTGNLYSGSVISKPDNPAMNEGDKVSFGPEHVAIIAHVTLRKTREKQKQDSRDSSGKRCRHASQANN
jgi:hypothetical protein